ncbi:MAG: MBL fold metallo-hydrolase, partial [Candidatus Paceibacterota bacterium]
MTAHIKKYVRIYFLGVLALAVLFVWYGVSTSAPNGTLTVAFLDVGQGDAIFIESPDKVQMLIDGGANRAVLSELSKVMPFYDRSIDVVLATHPDLDHIGGLPAVFQAFRVGAFFETPLTEESDAQETLHRYVADEGIEKKSGGGGG